MVKNKQGCGKSFVLGEEVAYRWGTMLCSECDKNHPAPFMAVYTVGGVNERILATFPTCGSAPTISYIKEVSNVLV